MFVAAAQEPTQLEAFVAALQAAAPDVRLLADPADREAYPLDETDYLVAGLPGAIALPAATTNAGRASGNRPNRR